MTTFFALLFGILLGFIAGMVFTVYIALSSSTLREFFEKIAIDTYPFIYDEEL